MEKYKNAIILGLLVALVLSVSQCTQAKKRTLDNLTASQDSITYYKNRIGTVTASKHTLQLTNKELKRTIYKKDTTINKLRKEFSKVKTIVKTKTVVKVDTVLVAFDSIVPGPAFVRTGAHADKWFNFDYTINPEGFSLTNIKIPSEQVVITGFKRKWLLGRQTLTTDITYTNPYIYTAEVKTVEVVVPKPFYDTRVFNIGLGLLGGYFIFK